MNIDAEKIEQLINESSNVIIMSHKNLDLDAFGSSLGIYYLVKSLGKEAYLLVEDKTNEIGISKSLNELEARKLNINIKSLDKLKQSIEDNSLLIILDVNDIKILQNQEILSIINKTILIDHHIADKDFIKNIIYKFIVELKSSTSEIVFELLKSLDIYIPPYIATIMLAGIFIDTKGFLQNVNASTFEVATFLYQQGAELKELQYLLKENANKYIERQKLISDFEIINNSIAICTGKEDKIYQKNDLAKASNTLLLFNNIEVGFTIAKLDSNIVGISARSLGNINVQQVMEKLNGGGHETDAATQLKNISIKEAKDKLLKIIYNIEL